MKTITVNEPLKRKIQRYAKLKGIEKRIADLIKPLKEEFKENGECEYLAIDAKGQTMKLASAQLVEKPEYTVKAQVNLVFRLH